MDFSIPFVFLLSVTKLRNNPCSSGINILDEKRSKNKKKRRLTALRNGGRRAIRSRHSRRGLKRRQRIRTRSMRVRQTGLAETARGDIVRVSQLSQPPSQVALFPR